MPVRIRLQRHGKKGKPIYWIVAADSRAKRDGRFLEKLGIYNPNTLPATVELNLDRAVDWLQNGAQPSDTARNLLSDHGAMLKNHLINGVNKGALTEDDVNAKFEAWLNDKESKNESIQKKIDSEAEKARAAAIAAEKEVSAKRKEAAAAAVAEAEAQEKAPVEEAAPEAKAQEEIPAEEAAPQAEAQEEAPAAEEEPAEEAAPQAKAQEEIPAEEAAPQAEAQEEAPAAEEEPAEEAAPQAEAQEEAPAAEEAPAEEVAPEAEAEAPAADDAETDSQE
jgi:small subunit ribosomal protein S16